MGKRRILLIFFILGTLVMLIVQCTQIESKDIRGTAYAGSETCVSCHSDLQHSDVHNAHLRSSGLLNPGSADSLEIPSGEFIFNEKTKVKVENRADGLYQIALVNGENKKEEKSAVYFGSGAHAYTFAFWYGNQLMQMPLNYLPAEKLWVNSPGFPEEQIYFGRPIITKCLECHSSYIKKDPIKTGTFKVQEEQYIQGSLIAGIDCERCHGPAAEHVNFHKKNPDEKKAYAMVKYETLSHSRKIDMCGVCHSGMGHQTLKSNFAFKPGDTLQALPQYRTYQGEDPDVHGKQKPLLEASKCYQIGKADCLSCHDIHGKTTMNLSLYSQKCISCHQDTKHETLPEKERAVLAANCIDCHMPVKTSRDIGFQLSNSKEKLPYRLRTHRIAIYQDVIAGKQ